MTILYILSAEVMFISEPIEVEKDPVKNEPSKFIWREEQKRITRILSSWQDWGFPSGVSRANWRQRRHRNYYRVECDDGSICEIYYDRKSVAKQEWFLYRIVEKSDIAGNK